MKSEELNGMLMKYFPDLKEKYIAEVSWQEGDSTGSHTIYGDVLTPYLVECIENNNVPEIKKTLDFLEEVLKLNDKYSDEVIAYSVIESVAYLFENSANLQSYLGNYSKKVLDEISPT